MVLKRRGVSLSEMLVALGIVGILCVTMLSLNTMSDNRYKIASTKLAQVDSALQSWGKAISKNNETGIGVLAVINNQETLSSSVEEYLNFNSLASFDTGITANDTPYGSNSNVITLNNGVKLTLAYNDSYGDVNNVYQRDDLNSPIATVISEISPTPDTTYKEEYAVLKSGIENISSLYEGYEHFEVEEIEIKNEDGSITVSKVFCMDETACGPSVCKDKICGCALNPQLCAPAPDDGKDIYIDTNNKQILACGSGQTGAITVTTVSTAYGSYKTTLDTCCASPKVANMVSGTKVCSCVKGVSALNAGYVFDANDEMCQVACEKGTYQSGEKCVLCDEGNYCNKEAMSLPEKCEPGYYCPNYTQREDKNKNDFYHESVYSISPVLNGGLIEKSICPKGYYCPTEGLSVPVICPKGAYCPDEGMVAPMYCKAGKYGKVLGATSEKDACVLCEENFYCPNAGMSDDDINQDNDTYKCDNSKGFYSLKGAVMCSTCAPGSYYDISKNSCEPCAAGSYSQNASSLSCELCDIGYYQDKPGSLECILCPDGTYAPEKGMAECKKCEGNKISTPQRNECVCPDDKPDWIPGADGEEGECIYSSARNCEDYGKDPNLIFISTPEQLASIGVDPKYPLDGNYCQVVDLDLSEYASSYDNGKGWKPIGSSYGTPFSGKYDGNDYSITNLYINKPYSHYQALFGFSTGTIKRISEINADITAYSYVGALTAYSKEQNIDNVHVVANIKTNGAYVGGIVGYQLAGSIENSSAKVNIDGGMYAGGIAGSFAGTMDEVSTAGEIKPFFSSGSYIGGIAGLISQGNAKNKIYNAYSDTIINNAYSYAGGIAGMAYYTDFDNVNNTADISALNVAGGLVGYNYFGAGIKNSSSNANITTTYPTALTGGLVGKLYYSKDVVDSYSVGNIITSGSYAGGLIGELTYSNLYNVSVNGNVTGSSFVGGLVGYANYGHIGDVEHIGSVDGLNYVAGLIGYNYSGSISDAIHTGEVQSTHPYAYTGGAFGYNYLANIINVYSEGDVITKGYYAGGLAGRVYNSKVLNVSAKGNVSGTYLVGGLFGSHEYGALNDAITEGDVVSTAVAGYTAGLIGYSVNVPIENAHHTGNIDAVGYYVGGLIGRGVNSPLTDVSSEGDVTGYYHVGGLVGNQYYGNITNAEAEGNVSSDHPTLSYAGGLVGYNFVSHISNATSVGDVDTVGSHAGGFIGHNHYSNLTDVSSSANKVTGSYYIGGLIGQNDASNITNATATADVFSNYYKDSYGFAGGLLGYDYFSVINNAHTTAKNVYSTGYYTGGLIGFASGTKLTNVSTLADTSGAYYVGGLIGAISNGSIKDAVAGGTSVMSSSSVHSYTGGIIGYNAYTPLTNVYTKAKEVVAKTYYVGGAIGHAIGSTITNIYSNADVTGAYHIGGLIGYQNVGKLLNSYATGDVKGIHTHYCYAGGLIGYAYASDNKYVYATGDVYARSTHDSCFAGGLIGQNHSGIITNAFSSGEVDANSEKYYSYAGGFVGDNLGTITNAYSYDLNVQTKQSPNKNVYGGGFAGYNRGTINNAYTLSRAYPGGGFVGLNTGKLKNTYWNLTLSNNENATSNGALTSYAQSRGFRTVDMKTVPSQEIYVGWSTNDWCFGKKYPTLKNMPNGAPDAMSCTLDICPVDSRGEFPNCVCNKKYYYETEIETFYNSLENICQTCADIDPLYPRWNVETQRCESCPDGLHYNPITNECQVCPYYGAVYVLRCTGEIGHVPATCAGRDLSTYASEYTGKMQRLYSKMSDATKQLSFEHAYIFDEDANRVATFQGKPGGNQLMRGEKINGVQLVNIDQSDSFDPAEPAEAIFEQEDGNICKYNVDTIYDKYFIIYTPGDPLVLDIAGNGIKLTNLDNGIMFDIDGNGKKVKVAWTDVMTEFDDAFLSLDKNENGKIDNGKELFGDKSGSDLGFLELAEYDTNDDRVINKYDNIYDRLLVWSDMNKNGEVDYEFCDKDCEKLFCNENNCTRELKTLEQAGIEEISVDYTVSYDEKGYLESDEHGNTVGQKGKFKMWIEETVEKIEEIFNELTGEIERYTVIVKQKALQVRDVIDVFLKSLEV